MEVRVKMKLMNPRDYYYYPQSSPRTLEVDEVLVDTGSVYTWISGNRLKEELEIEPLEDEQVFFLVDNTRITREIGQAVVECSGSTCVTMVVFAKKDDKQLLGHYTLEGLRLEVDPITRKLKKVRELPV